MCDGQIDLRLSLTQRVRDWSSRGSFRLAVRPGRPRTHGRCIRSRDRGQSAWSAAIRFDRAFPCSSPSSRRTGSATDCTWTPLPDRGIGAVGPACVPVNHSQGRHPVSDLSSNAPCRSVRLYAGAAVAGMATLVSVGVFAPKSWVATGVITPSVTASGTPGISATVRTITSNGQIDLYFSVTQPANICRLDGSCPPGSAIRPGRPT